jgi:translation initiation factor 5B
VTVMFVFAAVLLFSIIPSQVAFTSLISAGGVPTIAAYGLIAALRFTCTPHAFKTSHFYLGRWAKPMYLATVLFNGLVFAVRSLRCFLISFRLYFVYNRGGGYIGHDLAVLLPGHG